MANLVITAANVQPIDGTVIKTATAQVAILAGQYIQRDPITRKMVLGDANVPVASIENSGIALNSAAVGQPVSYAAPGGGVALGAVLAVGRIYVLSATPGAIAPAADLVNGDIAVVLGIARTTSILDLQTQTNGVVLA